MDEKVWQEFHCHRCPGQGTYILVKLNLALNHRVVVVCPKCKAKHERTIENGVLKDNGKTYHYTEEICPPLSACSDEPRSARMQQAQTREGAIIESSEQLARDAYMRELWVELYGGNT